MNTLEAKIAEALGALVIENQKLRIALEAAQKEVARLTDLNQSTSPKPNGAAHDAAPALHA